MSPRQTDTTCPYCGVGCGVTATVDGDTVTVCGSADHPANHGRLCSKGSALGETLGLEQRLLTPMIRGRETDWDTALDTVAHQLRRIIHDHGPDAVAFYVSGQLLTEDYYVANKLMKGYIGSANIDTNSRLCMASSVAGHKRAFGADAVPCCYEDLESASLIILVGSNAAWCHPVLYQRMVKAREAKPDLKVVVVDPRATASCDMADLHLPLESGSDAVLFNGLLAYLETEGCRNGDFVMRHTEGLDASLAAAQGSAGNIDTVARQCGLQAEDVAAFYALFAANEQVVTVYSQGVNQSASGTDKVNSIINCHLLTGRIGRPGAGPFSFTGQPNAMGGREVGGLANQLAAHMALENPQHRERVQRFWRAPTIASEAGLKAVDMFNAIGEGRIKAVWIMATNPAVSLPDSQRVREALAQCELVVVSDCHRHTDTTGLAHVLLPAAAWGEKDGTVTNSERRISRQRAFLPLPGQARPDWWIIAQVARRMGYGEAFGYASPADIFREHAALSGFENDGERLFDISALGTIDDRDYDGLTPVQWPVRAGCADGTPRLFSDGRFATDSGRAHFVAVAPRAPGHAPSGDFPWVLNTGRVRDHWHTMTRTALAPRLNEHSREPCLDIHPDDAAAAGVTDGGLARVRSRWGEVLLRVRVTAKQRPGNVFAPMHWNDQFASRGCIDAVVNPLTDPLSGQPESKHTPVAIEAFELAWSAFLLCRRPVAMSDATYWVRYNGAGFVGYELGGERRVTDWNQWLSQHVDGPGEWAEYRDDACQTFRGVKLHQGRLEACLFVAPPGALPPHEWLAGLFAEEALDDAARLAALAGRPATPQADNGRTVCACFAVGLNTLVAAIRDQGLVTAEAIGQALNAGTNCGSCVPEIKALINEHTRSRVA